MVWRTQTGLVVVKIALPPRTGIHTAPPQPWDMVTCSDPREQSSSCASSSIPLPRLAWV